MDGIISVNGKISSPEQAAIPALDRGFLFGDNVFEVLVGFYGQLLNVSEHFQRLRQSASNLGFEIPWSDSDLLSEIKDLADHVSSPKVNIRLVVTRGNGLGLHVPQNTEPHKVIYCYPAAIQDASIYAKGISLELLQSPATERGASAKTGNYLPSILALKSANARGFDDVLWTNADGELTEATTANVFLMGREGDLLEIATPAAESGILLGITRQTVVNLLNKAQIPVTERVIYADELARFDEGFVCSTVRGLVPISAINRHKLHSCRQNASFHHINRLYMGWVTNELGFAVDWNTGEKLDIDTSNWN